MHTFHGRQVSIRSYLFTWRRFCLPAVPVRKYNAAEEKSRINDEGKKDLEYDL